MIARLVVSSLLSVACLPDEASGQARPLERIALIASAEGGLNGLQILDVAVGKDGRVAVLFSDQRLVVWRDGDSRTVATQGAKTGGLLDASKIEYGPGDQLFVFDRKLNAITVFDAKGSLRTRSSVPVGLTGVRDIAVDEHGVLYIAGTADRNDSAQVHAFCPSIECYEYSAGQARHTRDAVAFKYFQSGSIALAPMTIYLAHVNPFWIEAIDKKSRNSTTIVQTPDLEDAEAVAFRRSGNQMKLSSQYPQVTGILRNSQGQLVVSAFVPGRAGSFVAFHDDVTGDRTLIARDPGFIAIKGILPNGDLVALRQFGKPEVVQFRMRSR